MEKVIYNLIYNRKKKLNAEGKALIQVEAYLNKQKKYFSTKVYITPGQWDKKRRSIKAHPNMDALNRYLQEFIFELERKELSMSLHGQSISLDQLKERSKLKVDTFNDFMKDEIERGNLKISTKKNHYSTLYLITQFKPHIHFQDLNFNFLCEFENYLLKNEYHRNTIAKHMKHVKRYLNLAINMDLYDISRYPFRKYKIKYTETKRSHLTPEELKKLESLHPMPRPSLQKCLDMFLFSCYTGLRFSDVVSIRNENFHEIDGKLWLIYSSVKTDVHVRLPLSLLFEGKAIDIYNRYHSTGRTLFRASPDGNSNINKQLLHIKRMAGLDKKVTFHTARHTNATLLLYNGANITTVQKLLGHKSVRTTEIYSNIMDMTIIRDLEKIK